MRKRKGDREKRKRRGERTRGGRGKREKEPVLAIQGYLGEVCLPTT